MEPNKQDQFTNIIVKRIQRVLHLQGTGSNY